MQKQKQIQNHIIKARRIMSDASAYHARRAVELICLELDGPTETAQTIGLQERAELGRVA